MPLIYLRDAEPSTLEMIQTVLREGKYGTVQPQEIFEIMDRSGALEKARTRANEYATDAATALDNLPDSDYCDSLRALPTYILDRDR